MSATDAMGGDLLSDLARSWYAPLREAVRRRAAADHLCEHTEAAGGCQFGERFLQIVWNEQRLSGPLSTTAGQRLEVLSPGTWNVSSGADFQHAVVRLDGEVRRGPVEVHREAADWYRHGHDRDPAYAEVVLHVVWRQGGGEPLPAGIPCLELEPHLAQPLRALLGELNAAVYPYARQVAPGHCAVRWAMTGDGAVQGLLRTAALARFEEKSMRLRRRAVAVGTEQMLYEALFDVLGYVVHRGAFGTLAREVPLEALRQLPDAAAREAMLFGAAGLLPDPSTPDILPEWRGRLRLLWDGWWRTGGRQIGLRWARSGSRPLNSPERRLAAGCLWLEACGLAPATHVLAIARSAASPREVLQRLRLDLPGRPEWEQTQDFRHRLVRPAGLLGRARADDLVINVLLPFVHASAQGAGDEARAAVARDAYLSAPRLQSNRKLVEAVHRFLVPPSRSRDVLRHAADQQGLLELYRCFCLALDGDCRACPFAAEHAFEDFLLRSMV
ncbi:MAG: DUF2851 family protein [Lentisphaeria bacterium]|nr:DUF2851 family protein [Lentisphaeria bacterium]